MCKEHQHLWATTWLELPKDNILNPEVSDDNLIENEQVAAEVDNKKLKLLELIEHWAVNADEVNQWDITLQSLTTVNKKDWKILKMAKKWLANTDEWLSTEVIESLIAMYWTDQEGIKILYDKIKNNSFEAALESYKTLVKNNTLWEANLDKEVLWSKTVKSLEVISTFIAESKDIAKSTKTYKVRVPTPISDFFWPLLVKVWFIPAEIKYREAKFEFEIWWSINQLNKLIENQPELDNLVAWMASAEENMIESYTERYKTYVALRYILVTTLENIKILESNWNVWDLDKLSKVKAEEKIRELNSMAEWLINHIAFMENYAVIEYMNAKQAKITAGRVEADYKMMQFLLAEKITSYERNEDLLKWVNLWVILKEANISLMEQSLSDMALLLGTQIEISIWADDFMKRLDSNLKLHIGEFKRLRKEEKTVKANQIKSLEDLETTAWKLKELENSWDYSLITPPEEVSKEKKK